MLVLSRRPGQRIHIGDNVVITVSKIAGNRVTIGIEAPREIPIHRIELMTQEIGSDLPPKSFKMVAGADSPANQLAEGR